MCTLPLKGVNYLSPDGFNKDIYLPFILGLYFYTFLFTLNMIITYSLFFVF